MYQFFRNDEPPQNCSEDVLIGCFEPCTDAVKRRLLAFIADDRAVRRTFVFDEERVVIIKSRVGTQPTLHKEEEDKMKK